MTMLIQPKAHLRKAIKVSKSRVSAHTEENQVKHKVHIPVLQQMKISVKMKKRTPLMKQIQTRKTYVSNRAMKQPPRLRRKKVSAQTIQLMRVKKKTQILRKKYQKKQKKRVNTPNIMY